MTETKISPTTKSHCHCKQQQEATTAADNNSHTTTNKDKPQLSIKTRSYCH